MKTNELRIGNLICPYLKNEGEIAKILSINGNEDCVFDNIYIECEESFEWTEPNKISGIILNEYWLLKSGFKEIKNEPRKWFKIKTKKRGVSLVICFSLKRISLDNGRYLIDFKYIKYLHQLQNLYFAITNEELKYEL